MKLICLNLWGGRVLKPLLEFLQNHRDVDIFCFQEIYNDAEKPMAQFELQPDLHLLKTLKEILPEYNIFFEPIIKEVFGIAIFIKKNIEVTGNGAIWLYENPNYKMMGGDHGRKMQWITFTNANKVCTIMNMHGVWTGTGKTDTPSRIEQSSRIKASMDVIAGPKILCGDFNLRPDTKSLEILEDGMINLVKTYNIPSTRSSLYTGSEKFADYILISPEINVADFKTLPDQVSDHVPLALDFDS